MKTLWHNVNTAAKNTQQPTRKQQRALEMQAKAINKGEVKPVMETSYKFKDSVKINKNTYVTPRMFDTRQTRQAIAKDPKTAARKEKNRRRKQSKNDRGI